MTDLDHTAPPLAVGRLASFGETIARLRPQKLGLRTRILLMFSLGALALSLSLAAAAYSFTRSSLLNQRDTSGVAQVYRNAQVAQNELRANNSTANAVVDRLRNVGVLNPALNYRGEWGQGPARFGPDAIPEALKQRVINDAVPARMITRVAGKTVLIVGIPLTTVSDASYFEFIGLDETNSTLRSVALSLVFGGLITTMAGGRMRISAIDTAIP